MAVEVVMVVLYKGFFIAGQFEKEIDFGSQMWSFSGVGHSNRACFRHA